MDSLSIARAAGENIKWMIIEFDEFDGNIFKGIKESYDYLTGKDLARGKV